MNRLSAAIASAAVGYVAGLLPSAQIVARVASRGVDPRRAGTGNPGAANVAALLGTRAGTVVAVLDAAKAIAAAHVGRTVAGPVGADVGACAAVLGHCFPAHHGFRGGKGVATSFGQMLATFPAYLPVDVLLGAVAAKSDFWKQRPVASMSAICGLWVGSAHLARRAGWPNLWAGAVGPSTPIAAAVSGAAIVYRFATEADRATPPDADGPTSRGMGAPVERVSRT